MRTKLRNVMKIIGGVIFINCVILLCWSVSFTIVSYVKEKRNESSVTAAMIHDGVLMADMLALHESSWMEGLERIAEHNQYSFIVIDKTGAEHRFGSMNEHFPELPGSAVQSVLAGSIHKEINRSHLFKSGFATIGVPLELGGKQAALFIQSTTSSLYDNYGTQLLTVFFGYFIMFLGMLALRPGIGKLESFIALLKRSAKCLRATSPSILTKGIRFKANTASWWTVFMIWLQSSVRSSKCAKRSYPTYRMRFNRR